MIPVGINYLYWYGIADGDAYKTLELTAKTGADAVEYSALEMSKWTKQERLDFRHAAENLGMVVAVTGGMGANFDLSSEDKEIRDGSVLLARKALEVCRDVGSKDWCGVIYSRWFAQPKVPVTKEFKQRMWERGVASLKEVVKTAEDYDVVLSIEILNRFEVYLLTTVELGLQYVKDIDSPYARLLMDVFHMNIEEYDMVEAIKKATSISKMGHLHVSESNRQVPGLVKTDMPWGKILNAVKDSGYNGIVSIESFVNMNAPNSVQLATWHDLVENPNEDNLVAAASKGISFLKKYLQ